MLISNKSPFPVTPVYKKHTVFISKYRSFVHILLNISNRQEHGRPVGLVRVPAILLSFPENGSLRQSTEVKPA